MPTKNENSESTEKEALGKEVIELQATKDALQNDIKALKEQIEKLSNGKDEAQKALDGVDAKKAELDELNKGIAAANASLSEIQAKKSALIEECKTLSEGRPIPSANSTPRLNVPPAPEGHQMLQSPHGDITPVKDALVESFLSQGYNYPS